MNEIPKALEDRLPEFIKTHVMPSFTNISALSGGRTRFYSCNSCVDIVEEDKITFHYVRYHDSKTMPELYQAWRHLE